MDTTTFFVRNPQKTSFRLSILRWEHHTNPKNASALQQTTTRDRRSYSLHSWGSTDHGLVEVLYLFIYPMGVGSLRVRILPVAFCSVFTEIIIAIDANHPEPSH